MNKFQSAIFLREYLNEQGIACSTGTNSGNVVTVAFYTENRTWMVESFDLDEWASDIAIGDYVINLFNHNGVIPAKKGESLYFKLTRRFDSGFRAKRQALDNAELDELLAAYRIAEDNRDESTKIILGLQIDLVDRNEN